MLLTKSDLASFRQCPRRLWLEKHSPQHADAGSRDNWRRARDGLLVGEKAREALGGAVVWPQAQESIEKSARIALELLSKSPGMPAVEVQLLHGELAARADALIPSGAGYVLQETKASTFPLKKDKTTPDTVDLHLLEDVAIQVWAMKTSGLTLDRAELNLLNGQWRYPGGGDYRGLFRPFVLGKELDAHVAEVPNWVRGAQATVQGEMPNLSVGTHCVNPYPCPFAKYCDSLEPPGPEHPIDLLPGSAGKNLARKLRDAKGYSSILDPSPEELTGKDQDVYRRIQAAHRSGQPILEKAAGDPFKTLGWPRFYLDFEGIDLAVPIWKGVRPYEQVPFQWSCHIEDASGTFHHKEFLDVSGGDPSTKFVASLLETIPPDLAGPIFVYNKTYEDGRLRDLAIRLPQHERSLQRLRDRLVDLFPLVRSSYYHPHMRGSFSIKAVLPTIAPELDYGELEGVSDGTAAQVAYINAALDSRSSQDRKEMLENGLRQYCKQDTWAMVEVAYKLQRQSRPKP